MSGDESKYKGRERHNPRSGMGRLRRANSKDTGRLSGWEQRAEDDEFLDRHAHQERRSHGGESLLARFNRLAQHASAPTGTPGEICGFQGRQVVVRGADGQERVCEIRSVLKKQVAGVKNVLCVGDRVRIETAPEPVITAIEPRRNQLERADSHNRSLVHVFAANIDVLVIVAALREPDLKRGLIDRYLVLAAACDIPAVVVINKADLADPAEDAALYHAIGVPVFTTVGHQGGGDIDALRDHLRGKTCVVCGQSGVGKSSVINALHPGFQARVGAVADEGHGRHTTTSARSVVLPDGGRLVDTPGIRECAVTGLKPLDVALLMPDLARFHPRCRFADCSHLHEPDCAVWAAAEAGDIAVSRFESYRSIIQEDLVERPS